MFKILTLNNISDTGLCVLPKDSYNVASDVESPDGVLVRSFNMNEYTISESVKAIARAGAGTNNIPVEKCAEEGIVVFNTPGANANAVKELVIAGLLVSSRKITQGISWAKGLKGQKGIDKLVEKGKADFVGPEIKGKKLGVIGLGAIGVMVCNAAKSLGMEVMGFDPYISVDSAWGLSRAINKAASLDTLLGSSDYISIHIPLNAKTKNMFDETLLKQVKKGAKLLNFSRAELVEFGALKANLENGNIDTYVTDFPNDQIIELENVICIPHLGASTPESEDNCAEMAARQLKDYLEYGIIKNSVNYPDCDLPYLGKKRVTIAHKNMPNLVSPITNVLGSHNINIDNMINKSRGNWAYTVIDVDSLEGKDITSELKAIEGVVAVRII